MQSFWLIFLAIMRLRHETKLSGGYRLLWVEELVYRCFASFWPASFLWQKFKLLILFSLLRRLILSISKIFLFFHLCICRLNRLIRGHFLNFLLLLLLFLFFVGSINYTHEFFKEVIECTCTVFLKLLNLICKV